MKKLLAVLVILSAAVPVQAICMAKQGVFSAGGIVLSTDGTFDPVHGQFDPKKTDSSRRSR